MKNWKIKRFYIPNNREKKKITYKDYLSFLLPSQQLIDCFTRFHLPTHWWLSYCLCTIYTFFCSFCFLLILCFSTVAKMFFNMTKKLLSNRCTLYDCDLWQIVILLYIFHISFYKIVDIKSIYYGKSWDSYFIYITWIKLGRCFCFVANMNI